MVIGEQGWEEKKHGFESKHLWREYFGLTSFEKNFFWAFKWYQSQRPKDLICEMCSDEMQGELITKLASNYWYFGQV